MLVDVSPDMLPSGLKQHAFTLFFTQNELWVYLDHATPQSEQQIGIIQIDQVHDVKGECVKDFKTALQPTEYHLFAQPCLEVTILKLHQIYGSQKPDQIILVAC